RSAQGFLYLAKQFHHLVNRPPAEPWARFQELPEMPAQGHQYFRPGCARGNGLFELRCPLGMPFGTEAVGDLLGLGIVLRVAHASLAGGKVGDWTQGAHNRISPLS